MKTTDVVLITGASSGLGWTTAHFLANQGFRVFGTSRNPDKVQTDAFRVLPLDVREADAVQACVQAVLNEAGRIDVLINNAGYAGPSAASEEMSLEQVKALFETNFMGAVRMTNAVLPIMRQQSGGTIINISSLAGIVGFPFFGAYVAAKHALEGYTKALRHEVHEFNIHVTLVEPGFFRTNIGQSVQEPEKPLAAYVRSRKLINARDRYCVEHGRDPILVARTIARIIHSETPHLSYPVGLDAMLASRLVRILPYSVIERVMHWLTLGQTDTDSTNDAAAWGFRRYLIDSKTADVIIPAALLGLCAAGLWSMARLLRLCIRSDMRK